jgi:RES domain-containing protein
LTLTVYRICKTKYAGRAFDGEGAFRFGGRWNSRGVRVVYTAGSLALAALEMLVHLDDDELLASYAFVAAQIPTALILPVASYRALPEDWDASPAPAELQQLGDDWAREQTSAALEVPTAIVPREKNYLLNPAHPGFARIKIEAPEPFAFDERLRR